VPLCTIHHTVSIRVNRVKTAGSEGSLLALALLDRGGFAYIPEDLFPVSLDALSCKVLQRGLLGLVVLGRGGRLAGMLGGEICGLDRWPGGLGVGGLSEGTLARGGAGFRERAEGLEGTRAQASLGRLWVVSRAHHVERERFDAGGSLIWCYLAAGASIAMTVMASLLRAER